MPGDHNANTKLLGGFIKRGLYDLVDAERESKSRSEFLRDAIVEYLENRNVQVPPELKGAPDRAGKGGPIKYKIKRPKKAS